ncbi:MAG: alpha/beta fold hydrolase [Bdellovibrionales bacterium]
MGFLEQFHHSIYGLESSPKLVFLHGLMGFAGNWRRITPAFEKDFQILTYDQRGHGRSFKPSGGYRPEDYADDLAKILEELGWEKIHLVGHSMGGRNAQNFAARFPQRVVKLVIEDIGPDTSEAAVQKIVDIIERAPTPFTDKVMAKDFFYNNYKDVSLGAYLYSNIEEKPNKTFDWRFSKEAILESVRLGRAQERWDELKSLKMPTLLIRGEKSEELPRDVYEKALTVNPLVKGVEIAGSGHWVHFDKPDEFIQALKKFF